MSGFVSRDGSPLAMYLALPADGTAAKVSSYAAQGASVLELGCGPGRTTRLLVAFGYEVTAVDDSTEMLAHVTGANTVHGDVLELDLDRRFDVVLAASHLINSPDPSHRAKLLAVCGRHVHERGVVLIERFVPGWLQTATRSEGEQGPIKATFEPGEADGDRRMFSATYHLGEKSWTQKSELEDVDNDKLRPEAYTAGLILDETELGDPGWTVLRPADRLQN